MEPVVTCACKINGVVKRSANNGINISRSMPYRELLLKAYEICCETLQLAAFHVIGRQPELWDAVTGKTAAEMLYAEDTATGVTEMPLRLPAHGSVFVIFEYPSGTHVTSLTRGNAAVVAESIPEDARPVIFRCGNVFCLNTTAPGDYDLTLSDD